MFMHRAKWQHLQQRFIERFANSKRNTNFLNYVGVRGSLDIVGFKCKMANVVPYNIQDRFSRLWNFILLFCLFVCSFCLFLCLHFSSLYFELGEGGVQITEAYLCVCEQWHPVTSFIYLRRVLYWCHQPRTWVVDRGRFDR